MELLSFQRGLWDFSEVAVVEALAWKVAALKRTIYEQLCGPELSHLFLSSLAWPNIIVQSCKIL